MLHSTCTLLLVCVALLCLASPASAEPRAFTTWVGPFVVAQGADLATTLVALHRGCHEANPLLRRASARQIIVVKSVTVPAVVTIAWGADRRQ